MKITIDNLDGNGPLDYTGTLAAASPLKIVRTRRAAAQASGRLDLNAASLPVPSRYARVVIGNDAGGVLFSGSLNTAPERVYAGAGTRGPVYTLAFAATGDIAPDMRSLVPEDSATHRFADGDGLLELAPPTANAVRELAADITLTGEMEPSTYITESFLGDGITSIFDLALPPFHRSGSATVLEERFDRAALDPGLWSVGDPGSFLSLSSAGFTMTGGNGFDGQTTLAAAEPLEIAGTLIVEMSGVTLGAASDGVLSGLYSGGITRDGCMAGFNVRQADGATQVTPLLNGVETGTTLTLLNGHSYRLRLRLHCPESVRLSQSYSVLVDGALRRFGGDAAPAPLTLLFEAQDMGLASNTQATVLHRASIAASPAFCTFAPVNSVQLVGSIAGCSIRQQGSVWITTTADDGTQTVRMTGAPGNGVDATLTTTGRITFFSGRIPLAGETITVNYRARQRAVARLKDAAAVAAHAAGGLPGTAMWQGRVTHPAARTTMDCENAALAALAFASARAAALTGSYSIVNPPQDIRPGDRLEVASDGDTLRLMVRSVAIGDDHTLPEALSYRIAFANDWAQCLAADLAAGPADDGLLPQSASDGPAAAIASLAAIAVVSATGAALQIDAGTAPPAGGGFEVRRTDWGFGPGNSSELVLRSPVRGFTIPRTAAVERFFVRMYMGSNTPVYSRFSSAIFTSLPVGE